MLQETIKSIENWKNFVELSRQVDKIHKEFLRRLCAEISKKWRSLNVEKWKLKPYICGEELHFRIDNYDNGVNICLGRNTENILSINCFPDISKEKLTRWKQENPEKAHKIQNLLSDKGFYYTFNEMCFCSEELSFDDYGKIITNQAQVRWYAGNRTEEFANQLIAKIWQLQTPEITAIFEEINKKCMA